MFPCISNQRFLIRSVPISSFSAINFFMSSLIWIQSSLLPIIPIRKSSAYLTYFSRFMSESISSLAGYLRRSLTIFFDLHHSVVDVQLRPLTFLLSQLTLAFLLSKTILLSDFLYAFSLYQIYLMYSLMYLSNLSR